MMMLVFLSLFLLSVIIIIIYLRRKGFSIRSNKSRLKTETEVKVKGKVSALIVVGSGGHTREILSLVKVLGSHYEPRYYVVADTDKMSMHKVHELEKEKGTQYQVCTIPRSREVKQSYVTSVFTTLRAILYSFPLMFRLQPDMIIITIRVYNKYKLLGILCNGPGTCIPLCVAGFCLKLLGLNRTVLVYVESFCRVTSLSLSGKMLYHFADTFFVQWPELVSKYPKAQYVGHLI